MNTSGAPGGVESQMDTLQGLPLEFIDRWLKIFDRQECMVLEDVQDLKEDYRNEYEDFNGPGDHQSGGGASGTGRSFLRCHWSG